MDLKLISELANSEATFALLFIACLFVIGKWFMNYMREQKEENKEREDQLIGNYKDQLEKSDNRELKLMNHLDENTKQLGNIADTLSGVEKRLTTFEGKVGSDLINVWKELGSKADKEQTIKRSD